MDYGHKYADEKLKELERKIKHEYRNTRKQLEKRALEFLEQFKESDRNMKKKVLSGEITNKLYKQWRKRQMLEVKQWRNIRDRLTKDIVSVDTLAHSMAFDIMPDIYAENYNFGTFEAEFFSGIDTTFSLYDEDTIHLLLEDGMAMPFDEFKTAKDTYWTRKNIQSAMLQGILQGDDISTIAARLAIVSENHNLKQAIRAARTMTTCAENAGRLESYKRAESMGIELSQMWMATLDSRTRHSHRLLDGEVRPVGHEFSNGLKYPGDPEGDPSEYANCRCTLVARFPEISYDYTDLSNRNTRHFTDKTYMDWKKARPSRKRGR